MLTGNFAWLNWATMVIAFSVIGLPGVGAAEVAPPTDAPWVLSASRSSG